jgi:hypothetical protein
LRATEVMENKRQGMKWWIHCDQNVLFNNTYVCLITEFILFKYVAVGRKNGNMFTKTLTLSFLLY